MRSLRSLAFGAAAILASVALGQKAPKPLVVVSWDGAADWVVDRLLLEGKLPNVARLAKSGVTAEWSTPPFPSKTAVSHVSIFTGSYPSTNGVVGNSVPLLPRGQHTILETMSGFDARAHLVEPLWITAAKAGKKVVPLSAAGSYPTQPDQERLAKAGGKLSNFIEFSGFESGFAPARMIDWNNASSQLQVDTEHRIIMFDVTVASNLVHVMVTDDAKDPVQGYDTVTLSWTTPQGPLKSAPIILKPREASEDTKSWSAPRTAIGENGLHGLVYFRLFDLDPQTGHMALYQRKASAIKGTETDAVNTAYEQAYGGFHDDAFFDVYQRGHLGKPVNSGGDGSAERRLLEIVRLDMEFLKRSFRYALKTWKPDLVFHYSPMSDSAGHTWMGVLDPESPAYDPTLAAKIMPYYEEVYELQDAWLGDMMDAAGPGAAFCLVSDHGMEGISKYFNVNVVLEKAGLLKRTADGKIDLTATKVCAPPWGDNMLVVNTTEWKGGIVSPAEKSQVLRQAEQALLSVRNPDTGEAIVVRTFDPLTTIGMGLGGPNGADLYLDFAPGYYPSSRLSGSTVSNTDGNIGSGVHGFWPQRRKMQAIFYLGGQNVAKNGLIPGVRTVDIMPTLLRLMGIRPPASVEGTAIVRATNG